MVELHTEHHEQQQHEQMVSLNYGAWENDIFIEMKRKHHDQHRWTRGLGPSERRAAILRGQISTKGQLEEREDILFAAAIFFTPLLTIDFFGWGKKKLITAQRSHKECQPWVPNGSQYTGVMWETPGGKCNEQGARSWDICLRHTRTTLQPIRSCVFFF